MLANRWKNLGEVDLRPLSELDTAGMRCTAAWLSPFLPAAWMEGNVTWGAWAGDVSGELTQADVPLVRDGKGIYIWLLAMGSRFRYLHVGLAQGKSSSLWARTQEHVRNAKNGKDFIYDLRRLGPRDPLPKGIEPTKVIETRASDEPSREAMLQENQRERASALRPYLSSIRVLYLPIERTSEYAVVDGQFAKAIKSIEASIDCAARGYFENDEAASKDPVVGNQFVQNSPSRTTSMIVEDLEAVRQALNGSGLKLFPSS